MGAADAPPPAPARSRPVRRRRRVARGRTSALARRGAWLGFGLIAAIAACYAVAFILATRDREPAPLPARRASRRAPNILLIGSDTLRADRLTGSGYRRDLTPNHRAVSPGAARPLHRLLRSRARAPRRASSRCSRAPGRTRHGVRDTFVTPEQTQLPVASLPRDPEARPVTARRSSATGPPPMPRSSQFGFEHKDLPPDQWNIKYLLRQGPKDLRLFLSLFTQNAFGKAFLPEIYYLGGHPADRGGRPRHAADDRQAGAGRCAVLPGVLHGDHASAVHVQVPVLLAVLRSRRIAASPSSTWPSCAIRGRSSARQGEPESEFDLEQIIDLYDGCVKNFDDEVGRILRLPRRRRICAENTIVVIFSDHGFEFFEHETWGQGNSAVGDFSARVPLIIADPRHRAGADRSREAVRTVDIAPTLLELAGLPVAGVHGRRVARAADARRGAPADQLPAFYETGVWLTDLPGTPRNAPALSPACPICSRCPDKQLGMISLKPEVPRHRHRRQGSHGPPRRLEAHLPAADRRAAVQAVQHPRRCRRASTTSSRSIPRDRRSSSCCSRTGWTTTRNPGARTASASDTQTVELRGRPAVRFRQPHLMNDVMGRPMPSTGARSP